MACPRKRWESEAGGERFSIHGSIEEEDEDDYNDDDDDDDDDEYP
jgi:hypothetical protein